MLIIPAIDLREGKCVRLVQGKADKQTVFSEDPAKVAARWQDAGAKRLHVVDLDGAFAGEPQNLEQFSNIRNNFKGIIEFGGGIRTEHDIKSLLNRGADRIILGTMACQSEDFIKQSIASFGNKFIAGIDARNGFVAIKGWVETTELRAESLGKTMESLGISEIIYTDILRDGMLTGPNLESLKDMLSAVSIPIIASGGIGSVNDLEQLAPLQQDGLSGVIIGKALYTGAIDINEVIQCWQKE